MTTLRTNPRLATTDAAATARFPQLRMLIELREAGWTFIPRMDAAGELFQLNGWRGWPHGYVDAIVVRYVTDAAALRARHTGATVWETDGSLTDVVRALLDLPAPNAAHAPRLARGTAPALWTP